MQQALEESNPREPAKGGGDQVIEPADQEANVVLPGVIQWTGYKSRWLK